MPSSKGIIQRNKRQLLFLCCKGHLAQIHQWLSLLQPLGGLNALHRYWSLCKVSAEWFCCMKQPCIFKDVLESRLDRRHSTILQTLIIAIAPLTICRVLSPSHLLVLSDFSALDAPNWRLRVCEWWKSQREVWHGGSTAEVTRQIAPPRRAHCTLNIAASPLLSKCNIFLTVIHCGAHDKKIMYFYHSLSEKWV